MEAIFENKSYPLTKVNSFTFDDVVMINGIIGYVDFIGEDGVGLITETGEPHYIKLKDIKEVYQLYSCWGNRSKTNLTL